MSLLVVAVLSLLWLGFFLPSLLEARRTSSPYASATTFQDSLRRLGEPPRPRPHAASVGDPAAARGRSRPAARAARRRRDLLAVLTAAVIGGVGIAVAFGGWAVWAPVVPAVALTGYVVMLRRDAVRRAARRTRSTLGTPGRDVSTAVAPPMPSPPTASAGDHTDTDVVPSVARRAAARTPERMAG